MLKRLLLSAAMLLPITALAAPAGVTLSPNKAITSYRGAPMRKTLPAWSPPKGKKAIIDTLGKPINFDGDDGWTVSNAQSETGSTQWIAYPITPTANATVTEIVEAIAYVTGGDSVTIALLADNNGVPGASLSMQVKANIEAAGNCCALVKATLKTGVPVVAGKTYWVAAILPKSSQATTWDAWDFSTANTNSVPFAYYTSSGWNLTSGPYTAFAVYGN